jgi:hypothetical protein
MRTSLAASGSTEKLNSALGVMLPLPAKYQKVLNPQLYRRGPGGSMS